MGKLIHSMSVSLDGYVADADGRFDWSVPDEELHQVHNDQVAEQGAHLLGRNLYETMVFWETADQDPEMGPVGHEFAAIWKALPKVVFSSTLSEVEGNTRLATESLEAELARVREETDRDIGVGGARLAGSYARLGLIDEYRLFVCPVLVGGGTPYFPPLDAHVDLELIETQTFPQGVVYLRYGR
jgi:dihydrofolate reductase